MATSNPDFPRRLIEGDDRQAALIVRALAEPAPGPSEQRSWNKLQQRGARFSPRWFLPAVAGGLSALALGVWLARPAPAPIVSPDVWARSTAATPLVLPTPSIEAKPTNVTPAPSERPKGVAAVRHENDAGECSLLAKAGQYPAAAACYGSVARGSSMDAELALYEKARLEAKALGQSSQALATLDEHGRRFPGGVLSTEVELTRIELLSQLGRRAEALQAIERGLRGALGSERGVDLQVLRAELLSAGGDCPAALEAALLARQAGAHATRLKTVEQRCPASFEQHP